ncbi:MAG: VRR-NUC domain-containing protein [Bacteroidales bacterium]|nr:VRR-NUC domain-containing protein [Bacteroidales bacterium]
MADNLDKMRSMANAPTRRRSRYLEDKLQMACKYWFDCQYPQYRLLLHHSPNEGLLMKHDRDGAKRKAMGMRPGFPDFIFLLPNRVYPFLALELKSEKGRQSDHQKEYQQAVEQAGGKYVIVRSLDEFIGQITAYMDNL